MQLALSLSFSVVHAKNTRAYGSIFQHLNILGSLEDRKKDETCAVEPAIRLQNSVAQTLRVLAAKPLEESVSYFA